MNNLNHDDTQKTENPRSSTVAAAAIFSAHEIPESNDDNAVGDNDGIPTESALDNEESESMASISKFENMTVETKTLDETQMILHFSPPFLQTSRKLSDASKPKTKLVIVSIDDSGTLLHIGNDSYELRKVCSVSLGDCHYQEQFHSSIDIECVFSIHYQLSDDNKDDIKDIVLETESMYQRDLWVYNIVQRSMTSRELRHTKFKSNLKDIEESSDDEI